MLHMNNVRFILLIASLTLVVVFAFSCSLDNANYCSGGEVIAKGEFTDSRDGQKYRYVTIGSQTWMADNLNYNAAGSKCGSKTGTPVVSGGYCDIYGRLYDYETALENVCPAGWHLPDNAEWDELFRYVVNGTSDAADSSYYATAGKYLKAACGWNEKGNGTDDFGFAALPGGFGNYRGAGFYDYAGKYGHWWSATEHNVYIYYFGIGSGNGILGGEFIYSDFLFSIRCVHD